MNITSIQRDLERNGFVRSEQGMIGGVCAGLAQRHNLNVWALRLLFLLLTPVIHVAPLLYLAGMILMPVAGTVPVGPAAGMPGAPAPAGPAAPATGTQYPAA